MANIRYIKEQDEQVFLPVTHERAVIDSEGVNLETKLSQIGTDITNKQAVLVSGDNIKTLNNTSLLGSGNIDVQTLITTDSAPTFGSVNPVESGGVYTALTGKQETLVSGTNIKTINNTSLLGTGNIQVDADTSSCEKLSNKVTSISDSSTDTEYPTAKCVFNLLAAALQNLISYPVFSINNSMHLIISSPDASALSLFSVNSDGHLLMTV